MERTAEPALSLSKGLKASPALRLLRLLPQIKVIRRALGLTQEEFSTRYRIPLGTLRDWEQGRAIPDQPTQAYLTVIARSPEGVQRALGS